MRLSYVFLLICFVLAACDETEINLQETLDDIDYDVDEDVNNDDVDEDVNDDDVDEDVNDDDVDEDVNDDDVDEDLNDDHVDDVTILLADTGTEHREPHESDEDEAAADTFDYGNNDFKTRNSDKETTRDTTAAQIATTTVLSVTQPKTHRRADLANLQKSHRTLDKTSKTAASHQSQRGKLKHEKGIKNVKNARVAVKNHTDIDPSTKDGKDGGFRRKRLQSSSGASPSLQLIIIVVGAVLACVLITGFIRWRVRKRLNDKKLGKMADNLAAYRSRMALPKTSIMDTIYECECEDRLTALRAQYTPDIDDTLATEDSAENTKSKHQEMCCSHRFDKPPPSMSSSRHYDSDSHVKSSKGDREYDRMHTSKRHSAGHKRHHSHKSRYSRHHRRKSYDKTSTQKLERIPITNSTSAEDSVDNVTCLTPLLEQTESSNTGRGQAQPTAASTGPVDLPQSSHQHSRDLIDLPQSSHQHSGDLIGLPQSSHQHSRDLIGLPQSSHQQPRDLIGSLMNTWRSLSFNRDWVGRMWQEKHNVRRISDVLRNLTKSADTDSQTSPSEGQASGEDVPAPVSADLSCGQTDVSTTSHDIHSHNSGGSEPPAHDDNSETILHSQVADSLSESSGLHEQSMTNIPVSRTDISEAAVEPDNGHSGPLPEFLSFHDYREGPPEYESLLESEGLFNHCMPHGNTEHTRHHRRHRRKRSEGRDRSHRHAHSRDHTSDFSHTDNRHSSLPQSHEEYTPMTSDTKQHDISTHSSLEPQAADAATINTPMCSSDIAEDPNRSQHVFTHSPNGHGISTAAAPFVPQEGIVLEQLSDGAQIIYLPPPALPSYHNDTPPPYHK